MLFYWDANQNIKEDRIDAEQLYASVEREEIVWAV